MTHLPRLLKVGSIADAMGTYVAAMACQKALGLARIWMFAYLMREARAEYGLWGVGLMLLTLIGRMLNLGANQGIIRYLSYYEVRGRLDEFYRRIRLGLVGLIAVCALLALTVGGPVTRYVIASRSEVSATGGYWNIYIVVLLNAAAIALYHCLLAFMSGMRTYRLLSAMEVLFSVVFTALGVAALCIERSAMAILLSHLAAMSVCMLVGAAALHKSIVRASHDHALVGAKGLAEDDGRDGEASVMKRILGFGLFAMIATLAWSLAQYVGFHIAQRFYGKEAAAPFTLMMQLSQPVLFVANAAWAVLFSHAARYWEKGDHKGAIFRLETAYKAVAVGAMTLTVVIYATSDLWMSLLPPEYRQGQALLCGLLLLFQSMTQLSILTMIAKLHERPLVIAAVAAGAVALNVTLALSWMESGGIAAIATAGGIGMCAGGGVIAVGYMLLSRSGLHLRTYLVMALPALLLLDVRVLIPAWAILLVLAAFSGLLFDSHQKHAIIGGFAKLVGRLKRTRPDS